MLQARVAGNLQLEICALVTVLTHSHDNADINASRDLVQQPCVFSPKYELKVSCTQGTLQN